MGHDWLEPLEFSVTEAARYLGISRERRSATVSSCPGISPEMAIRPDKAFGGADAWLRLQSTWNPAEAGKKANRIKAERFSPAA